MISKTPASALLAVIILLTQMAFPSWAQTLPGAPEPGGTAVVKDALGRDTPQGLVTNLINALAAEDYERVTRYFALDRVRGFAGQESISGAQLARAFQQALDRGGDLTSPATLSSEPEGIPNDGLPEDSDLIGHIDSGDREIPLLAERLEQDGMLVWLVSAETLADIPALVRAPDAAGSGVGLLDWLPKGAAIDGVPLAHWLALILVAGLSLAIATALLRARAPLTFLLRQGGDETTLTRFLNDVAGPLRLLLAVIIFSLAVQALGFSLVARYRVLFLSQLIGWFAFVWLLWKSSDTAGELILSGMSRRGQVTAYAAVSFLKRALKVLLGILFLVAVLRAFGVDVTTGLAALGIGGLAIALGAQKLFENLIGSLTLIADRPIRIGDFCRFGTTLGTVEDIGIRSTRIRTLDRTVLTVPNGEFSSLHIENYSQRDKFWFHPVLKLRYDTRPDQLRVLLRNIRAVLLEHSQVEPESARVRLIGLATHSLEVEIFCYVKAADYDDFLAAQEDLLLHCMEVVEASGTAFALPSGTLFVGRDSGLDENKTQDALAAAETWRKQEHAREQASAVHVAAERRVGPEAHPKPSRRFYNRQKRAT